MTKKYVLGVHSVFTLFLECSTFSGKRKNYLSNHSKAKHL